MFGDDLAVLHVDTSMTGNPGITMDGKRWSSVRSPDATYLYSQIKLLVCYVYFTSRSTSFSLIAPNCIKHFHWTIRLFWPIRFDVTIVSSGNNCNAKPD